MVALLTIFIQNVASFVPPPNWNQLTPKIVAWQQAKLPYGNIDDSDYIDCVQQILATCPHLPQQDQHRCWFLLP